MSEPLAWAALVVSISAIVVGAWQWKRTEERAKLQDARLDEVRRTQQLSEAKQAIDRAVARWRVSSLSDLDLSLDPDVPGIAASSKEWRHSAAESLVSIAAAFPEGKSRPYRLVEQAVQTLKDFEGEIVPVAVQYSRNEQQLWQDDPDWKARLDLSIDEMQRAMTATIDELDSVSASTIRADDVSTGSDG